MSDETVRLTKPGDRRDTEDTARQQGAAPVEATGGSGAARAAGRPGGSGVEDRGTRPVRFDPRAGTGRPGARRRARLGVTRVDPWSVFLLSFLVSLFLGVILVVAVVVLYLLLSSLGVLEAVDTFARDLQLIDADTSLLRLPTVLGIAAVLAAVDAVLLTALATLGAFLYNLCASLTGGVDVVLVERD